VSHDINIWTSSKYFSNLDVVLLTADGHEVFKPYQFKMEEIEGLRYRSKVSNLATFGNLHYFQYVCSKKIKVAHIRLQSIGFRS